MYCPNCAAPIDGLKFCRSCGANVSLVAQAMEGKPRWKPHRDKKEPSIEKAASDFFSGVGFLLAAIFVCFYFPVGFTWGWVFLFPAFAFIGEGVGQYLRLKERQRQQASLNQPNNQSTIYHPPAPAISAPTTSELVIPPSVTEHTTQQLVENLGNNPPLH
jgi:hypothetical protein